MTDLITVIIPVYNVEAHLEKCVSSVICQTYSNLEIILVDDGSKDKSGQICDELAKKDSRIKVLHKKNGGLSDARNAALDIAKGEYLIFFDSDDWISQNLINDLYLASKKENADIAISDMMLVYDKDITKSPEKEQICQVYSTKQALEVMLLQKEFNNGAVSKLFKKHLFENKRFSYGILYEDFDIIYNIFMMANKIVYSNKETYFYFQNQKSITHEQMDERHFILVDLAKRVMDEITDVYPDLADAALCRYVFSNFYILDRITFNKSQKKYKEKVCVIRQNLKNHKKEIFSSKAITSLVKIKTLSFLMGFPVYKLLLTIYKASGRGN